MKRLTIFIVILLLFSLSISTISFANSNEMVALGTWRNSLDGYLKYSNGYYLDIEELGILDSGADILNRVANVLFSGISTLGYAVSALFVHCFNFDISELLGDEINAIQSAMKNSIFDSFFILAFAFAAIEFLKKLIQRNISGIFSDFMKILSIILLSYFVVSHSAIALSGATEIAKDIGTSAISALKGGMERKDISIEISESLWKSLVHDPWVTLEFQNYDASESEIKAILKKSPNSSARQAIIQSYVSEEGDGPFNKNLGAWRIGIMIVYIIPFFIKCAVFMLMAIMQLAFQVMAVFYVLMAPVILLMALVPALGGINLIFNWFKKIVESQLMILIITFLIGIVTTVDSLLYSKRSEFGWLIVVLIEAFISIIVLFNYKTILSEFGRINKSSEALMNPTSKALETTSGAVIGAAGYIAGKMPPLPSLAGTSNQQNSSNKTLGEGNNNIRGRIQAQIEEESPAVSQGIPMPDYISVTEMRHIEMYRGGTPYQHAQEAAERDDAHNPVERPMMPHNTVIEVTAEPINVSDTDTHSADRPNAAEQMADSSSSAPAENRPTTAEKPPATVFSASTVNSQPVIQNASAGDSPAEQPQHTVHADFAAANVSASGARGNIERPTLSQLDTTPPAPKSPPQRPSAPERPQKAAYTPHTPAVPHVNSVSSSAAASRPNTPR